MGLPAGSKEAQWKNHGNSGGYVGGITNTPWNGNPRGVGGPKGKKTSVDGVSGYFREPHIHTCS